MFVKNDKEEINQAYILNHNFVSQNKVICFIITDAQKWNYLRVKKKYQHYCEELYQRIMVIVISLTVFLHLERKAEQISSHTHNLAGRFHNSKCNVYIVNLFLLSRIYKSSRQIIDI